MARKTTKGTTDLSTDLKRPDWYERMCEEVVVKEGGGNKELLVGLVKFKDDKTIQELGFTKPEIEQHLKHLYISTLRDLKNPISLVAKEMLDLKIAIEKQRLVEIQRKDVTRGDDDIISPTQLKYYSIMYDLMKEINKYTLKSRKEVTVKHQYHDETDGVIDGKWGKVINVTPDNEEN